MCAETQQADALTHLHALVGIQQPSAEAHVEELAKVGFENLLCRFSAHAQDTVRKQGEETKKERGAKEEQGRVVRS